MIEQLRNVKIELIEKLTVQDVLSRMVAQFDSMFMDLETNNASRTWKIEFNSKMIQLFEDRFTYTTLTPEDFDYIKAKVLRIIENKKEEGHVIKDPVRLYERWINGKNGECAFAKQLGYDFVDYKAYEKSSRADVADVLGLAGVKTSKIGNFPGVSRRQATYPEIIMIEGADGRYYNTGMYHASDLNTFRHDGLIFDSRMRQHKTAFYNYGRGLQFGPGLENFYDAVSALTGRSLSDVRSDGAAAVEELEKQRLLEE
jgi:hypothetical protein